MPTFERMRGQEARIITRAHNREESTGGDVNAGYLETRDLTRRQLSCRGVSAYSTSSSDLVASGRRPSGQPTRGRPPRGVECGVVVGVATDQRRTRTDRPDKQVAEQLVRVRHAGVRNPLGGVALRTHLVNK
jgi:hypothetical protein